MFTLTETQAELQAAVERFAAAEIAPRVRDWDAAEEFPRHLFPLLGELGWLGIGFDEGIGGSGGGPVERCILVEGLARASAGVALGIYVHMVLAAGALAAIAGPDLAGRLLPALLSGEMCGAWAYAEPDSGADVTRVNLRAKRDGDSYVLEGTKLYITNGTFADVILVVARTAGEPGTLKGLSVLAVDGDSPGLTRLPMKKLGMRASELGELVFSGCTVPTDRLVGEEHAGFRQCLPVLSQGRIFGGALALGLGRAAVDEATRHVLSREQFGGRGPVSRVRGSCGDGPRPFLRHRSVNSQARGLRDRHFPRRTGHAPARSGGLHGRRHRRSSLPGLQDPRIQ
ncbi:MAG: acyl-CoA dehydrogenase [Actinobacteria bacterium ATB1]|nr:acyl-CoA dehydrogenase [Actinobacteria bacterium ATB1]